MGQEVEALPAFGRYRALERVGAEPGADRWLAVAPGDPAELVWIIACHDAAPAHLAEDIRHAGMVQHADVSRVLEVGRANGLPFVVVEHVDGIDLATLITLLDAQSECVPVGFAASIVLELCRVVHHLECRTDEAGAHLGWVLRGLPLDRVWLRVDGRVRVDLRGLVCPADAAVARGPTPGSFASPELRGKGTVDARSDVWILGAVLQRLVTGRVAGGDEVLRAAEAPVATRASVASIAGLLARSTASAPDERYDNAKDLGDALRRAALVGTAPRLVRQVMASWVCDLGARTLEEQAARVADRLGALSDERVREEAERAANATGRLRAARRGPAVWGALLAALTLGGSVMAFQARPTQTPTVTPRATGAIRVVSDEAVQVTVDGRGQGTGREVEVSGLTAGSHDVVTRAEGFVEARHRVAVPSGGTALLRVKLAPVEVVAPSVVRVTSRPAGAAVLVDGRRVGETPLRYTLAGGRTSARIEVSKPGFSPESRTVRGLKPGDQRAVSVTLGPATGGGGE